MIKISKEVAHKLHDIYGVRFGENGISKTVTKYPKYYLCESEYNLRSLLKITTDEKAQKLLDDLEKRRSKNKSYRR